jgi:hypothetical protein
MFSSLPPANGPSNVTRPADDVPSADAFAYSRKRPPYGTKVSNEKKVPQIVKIVIVVGIRRPRNLKDFLWTF